MLSHWIVIMTPDEIKQLLNPTAYPHVVGDVQLIETHISWVILTGSYAYKIKKPVNLGFLDFSELEQREKYCHEELRLNRRTASSLYLAVVEVRLSAGQLHIGGEGELVDYAVQMTQFDSNALLADHVEQTSLPQTVWQQLAKTVADFHRDAEVFVDGVFACAEVVQFASNENFEQIRPYLTVDADIHSINNIEAWMREQGKNLEPLIEGRKCHGFVRECHGDLHLGNLALIKGRVVPFDCVEFNENFRIIDTASEIAFTVMDLDVRGLSQDANVFLNTYIEQSGDYQSLSLLSYYKVYRAMVRAKVSLLSTLIKENGSLPETKNYKQYQRYVELAAHYVKEQPAFIAIMHGVSGSGKSYQAQRLAGAMGAIRLRSDVERKRLFGLSAEESSDAVVDGGIYTAEASEKTFARLAEIAQGIVNTGISCIVDATFLHQKRREQFHDVAKRCGVPFVIIDCQASEKTILKRLSNRQQKGGDASEADEQIMRNQVKNREVLSNSEQQYTVVTDTMTPIDINALRNRLCVIAGNNDNNSSL